MPTRDVRLRALAAADIAGALEHYRREAGDALALDFVDALEHAIRHIQRSPRTGSLQFSYDLGIPELRARRLSRFPFMIFYVQRDEYIDVWRLLHGRRDLPNALRATQ